jgi:hypothetical protein
MLLTNEISIKRKIKEILLASRIVAALPKDRIDPKGNWEARLAKLRIPAVVTDVGWQLAVVIRTDRDGEAIGLKGGVTGHIAFSKMHWVPPMARQRPLWTLSAHRSGCRKAGRCRDGRIVKLGV